MRSVCTRRRIWPNSGAGDIVLTSRRAPDADAQRAIEDITERYRCRIHTFAADVGDESEVAKLLDRIRAELPPLAGWRIWPACSTMRAAVAAEPGAIPNDVGAQGVRCLPLDRLTKDDDLDFFIVSSSVSSMFGSPGQANYATANALLDGLVARKKGAGPAGHGRQLRSLGPGWHGLFGGRARQSSVRRAWFRWNPRPR